MLGGTWVQVVRLVKFLIHLWVDFVYSWLWHLLGIGKRIAEHYFFFFIHLNLLVRLLVLSLVRCSCHRQSCKRFLIRGLINRWSSINVFCAFFIRALFPAVILVRGVVWNHAVLVGLYWYFCHW